MNLILTPQAQLTYDEAVRGLNDLVSGFKPEDSISLMMKWSGPLPLISPGQDFQDSA